MTRCDIRCQTAETPEEECECSCGGEYHGGQPSLDEFDGGDDDGDGDDNAVDEEYTCENCGAPQSFRDYWAVSRGTPAARRLNLGDPSQDGHHVVCEVCYESVIDDMEDR